VKQILTVTGPIEPSGLGFTSMHDHLMFDGRYLVERHRRNMPDNPFPIERSDLVTLENVGILHRNIFLCDDAHNQADEEALVGEVADFKAAGGGAILEVSAPGIAIDPASNRRISERTGVHVIASTGLYSWDSWPDELRDLNVDGHYKRMMNEVEHGVGGSDVLPGHVKIAMEYFNTGEESALRAAAHVAAETGFSLTVHPSSGTGDLMRILSVLKEEGMDLERVVMAHTVVVDKPSFAEVIRRPESYRVNIDTALRMLDTGCTICKEYMNFFGLELLGSYDAGDWADMAGLVQIINRGYEKQIVLGNDCCAKIMLRRFGGEGYCRMLWYTLPMLRDMAGVSAHAIHAIFYDNPARLLAREVQG